MFQPGVKLPLLASTDRSKASGASRGDPHSSTEPIDWKETGGVASRKVLVVSEGPLQALGPEGTLHKGESLRECQSLARTHAGTPAEGPRWQSRVWQPPLNVEVAGVGVGGTVDHGTRVTVYHERICRHAAPADLEIVLADQAHLKGSGRIGAVHLGDQCIERAVDNVSRPRRHSVPDVCLQLRREGELLEA